MAWTWVRGELVIAGYQPDGDSVRFVPDDLATLRTLENGKRVEPSRRDGSVQLRLEPVNPAAEPVVGDDESTEVGWFPISRMPVTDPKWRLAIADAAAQRRHPASFTPRMGLSKR